MEREIHVEYVDYENVKEWPRNPKDHDLHELKKSFHRFGFTKPILIDEGTGQLVAGHGRLETLGLIKERGEGRPKGIKEVDGKWYIPVLRGVEFDDPSEAEAYLLADNRLSEIGGWHESMLSTMIEEMGDVDGLLEGTGFEDRAVDAILKSHERLTETKEKVRSYSKVHVMLSVPVDKVSHISHLLEEIIAVDGVQFDTTSN